MKRKLLAAAMAAALLGAAGPTFSQLPRPGEDPARHRAAQAANQQKFDDYKGFKAGRGDNRNLITELLAWGLPATRANADSLVQLLESPKVDKADRMMLAVFASQLHSALGQVGDTASKNAVREAVARVAKNDPEDKVRRAATLTHSRMGYFLESLPLLRQNVPVLGDITYHQELAHMMLAAPGDDQVKIIKEMAAGEGHNNALGKSILAEMMRNPDLVNRALAPQAVKPLLDLFVKGEPGFNQADPKAIGFGSLTDYYEWLDAVANLTARATGEAPRYTVARLVKLDGDPRKLMAAFGSEQSGALMRSALSVKDLDMIDATIRAFAAKYPGNKNIEFFATLTRGNIYEKPAAKQ